jgi:hypothetical protein
MPSRAPPYPLFDADNHLYETQDAMTRYLPREYQGAIQYVQVNGRTKIAIRGQISEYIPNPTFEVVPRPGAMEEYFRVGNPEGKSRREIFGEPMRSIPAFREPGPRLELMEELGIQHDQAAGGQLANDAPGPGGGQVVDGAGQRAGDPQDLTVGGGDDLQVHAVAAVLAGVERPVGGDPVDGD